VPPAVPPLPPAGVLLHAASNNIAAVTTVSARRDPFIR
jgi:hypothetical protein